MKLLSKRTVLTCGSALAGLAFAVPGFAQEQAPAPQPAPAPAGVPQDAGLNAGDAIVVTGSRIRRGGFDSPVPVTVVDAGLVEDLGQVNASEVVRLIPQNIATQSDAVAGLRFSADIGAAYANLRGLNPQFGTRTLTLVNTRRFVPTSDGGQVDLNLIPSIMIGRVETVTGGASAAYGSDAVAGVVNIILDNQLDGFKGQVDYGMTGQGDGETYHAAAAYGFRFGEDRGHFMIGGEYQNNEGVANCYEARDWCSEGWAFFTNEATIPPGMLNSPANVAGYNVPGSFGYGQPNYVLGRDAGLVYNHPYGTVRNLVRSPSTSSTAWNINAPEINPPLAAVDKIFTPDGTGIEDFNPGLYPQKNVGTLASGGDNDSVYDNQYIQTPMERYTIYAAAEYELSDALKIFAEATYAERSSNSQSLTAATRSTIALKSDNAFLPEELRTLLNGANFSMGKDIDHELANRISVDAQVFRGVLGLEGTLFSDWTWDAYYQYGENNRDSSVRYSRHNDSFVMALDAIEDPNNPGQIICRPLDPVLLATFTPEYQAELNDLYSRCVPINMFGQGNLTQEGIDFAWHPLAEDFKYHQHVLAASVQGSLFDGFGAGPVGFAAGVDYRDEGGDVTHGGVNANAYAFSWGLDYAGKIQVIEGFAETNVPVFRDSAIGDLLELNGAIRYTSNKSTDTLTDQSRTVNATSWKIGAIYDITGGLRLRATQSRDIRAAGFRELFQKTAPTDEGTPQGRVNNQNIPGPNKNDAAPIYSGGNFTLLPEKGDTTTIGAVVTPTFLPGFQLSVDWYQIKLKDAIADLNGQRVTDLCVEYDVLCDRVTFASPTDITRVDAGAANVGRLEIRGFDVEVAYRQPLSDLWSSANGAIDLRFLLNNQYDFIVTQSPAVPSVDYAGQTGPVVDGGDFNPTARWTWNALVGYSTERFNSTVTVRHVGKGIYSADFIGPEDPGYDPTLRNSVSTNRVDGATYVNLALSYEIPFGSDEDDYVEIFGSIENLFDKRPPIAPGGGPSRAATAYPTNPVFFDTLGMRWKAGMRVQF